MPDQPAFPTAKRPDGAPIGPPPELLDQMNTLAARLRLSEERYVELRRKLVVIEQNMLANHKRVMTEVKTFQEEFSEARRVIREIEDRVIALIKEVQLAPKREDFEVLKKYIELWNPLRFATVDHVEKICREMLDGGKQQPPPPAEPE